MKVCSFLNLFRDTLQSEKQPHIKNDKVCTLNSLYFSVKLGDGMDPIPASFHLRKNSTKKP